MTVWGASNVWRKSQNFLASLTAEPGGTETSGTPRRRFQRGCLAPLDPRVRCHHELRDLHAARDGESFRAMVDEDGCHLAAIIGIDSSRRVQHRYAMAKREPRSRPQLSLESFGERQRDARRHRGMAAGLDGQL